MSNPAPFRDSRIEKATHDLVNRLRTIVSDEAKAEVIRTGISELVRDELLEVRGAVRKAVETYFAGKESKDFEQRYGQKQLEAAERVLEVTIDHMIERATSRDLSKT